MLGINLRNGLKNRIIRLRNLRLDAHKLNYINFKTIPSYKDIKFSAVYCRSQIWFK